MSASQPSQHYLEHGYELGPIVLNKDTLVSANTAMDNIIHDTPHRSNMGEKYNPKRDLGKFNEAHIYSPELFRAITTPALGQAISTITGSKRVQVWATQMLNKPAGKTKGASVGWHQDYQYWQAFWTPDSELFTVWLAISDVESSSGPVNFIDRSHKWGFLNAGNFFQDIQQQGTKDFPIPKGESWKEIPATMPAGAFSLHHCHTFHGSYPNVSTSTRKSIAIHLCSDKATPTPGKTHGYDYAKYLSDPEKCPVIFDATDTRS